MFTQYVITHPEMGVYLGSAVGFAFWTRLNPVGQDRVVTFTTKNQARQHVLSWDTCNNPRNYRFVEVNTAMDGYATITELKAAGLHTLLGEMEIDALRHAKAAGSA
jgi:hypothetical protein